MRIILEPIGLISALLVPFLAIATYIEPGDYPGELCNRECLPGENRICYFQFTLEYYQAMGIACGNCGNGNYTDCNHPQCVVGDGVEKGVMSINRQVPGPAIHVCRGDYLIVDVINNAHGSAAALHWHGMHMRETPFMDGVPFITQCPIPYANSFRYEFRATEPGTHFYHSHSGHHKINGQYGALIVRAPRTEVPNIEAYDHDLPEHYVLISDWMHSYGEQYFPGLRGTGGIFPDSVLINGRGIYTNLETGEQTDVPPTIYYVRAGERYRFRLINSISHACPFQLQIEQHSLTVIASDSFELEPSLFDTLVSNAGERYDFVLTANHSSGDFLMRVRGMGVCAINPTESFAIIRYVDDDDDSSNELLDFSTMLPEYNETYPTGRILNHPNSSCFNTYEEQCITGLNAIDLDQELLLAQPSHRFFLAFNNYPVDNKELFEPGRYNHFVNLGGDLAVVGAINNLSLVFPDAPPLTQFRDIDSNGPAFCDELNWPEHCVDKQLCPCIHRLEVPLGSIVELVIVDESQNVGRMHHPFHLHGYRFMVTALGQHPLGVPMTVALAHQMERARILPRTIYNGRPPFKDTVSIPSRGFAIVRFRADNPGFWLMHCHYEWHIAIGMGLVLQVGRPTQMERAPSNFPECGNYLPRVRQPRFR